MGSVVLFPFLEQNGNIKINIKNNNTLIGADPQNMFILSLYFKILIKYFLCPGFKPRTTEIYSYAIISLFE